MDGASGGAPGVASEGAGAVVWAVVRAKGKEQKRPKSKLCNPSRSFFFVLCALVKNRALLQELSKNLEALSPEIGEIVGEGPPNPS